MARSRLDLGRVHGDAVCGGIVSRVGVRSVVPGRPGLPAPPIMAVTTRCVGGRLLLRGVARRRPGVFRCRPATVPPALMRFMPPREPFLALATPAGLPPVLVIQPLGPERRGQTLEPTAEVACGLGPRFGSLDLLVHL